MTDEEGGAFELGTDGPKVILVGVDDSVTSMRAGAYAAGLARRQGARLVCVYVAQPSALYGATAGAGAGAIAAQDQALEETAADLRGRAEETPGRWACRSRSWSPAATRTPNCGGWPTRCAPTPSSSGASAQAGHRWIGSLAVRLVKAGRWPVTVVP